MHVVPVLNSIKMSCRVITIFLIVLALKSAVLSQDHGIEFVSGPEFRLSERAVAAGIDGSLTVSFKVDKLGNVSDVDVIAGPIWPCDSSPGAVIKEVRDAVEANILASKFSPATKGGKPIDSRATLDFALGIAYREAMQGKTNAKTKWVVDVGTLQARATQLPKPMYVGIPGTATVRVLIDESGDVIAAGAIRGHPALHVPSRRAACEAKFPPPTVEGKAMKITGVIHYDYSRWGVTAR